MSPASEVQEMALRLSSRLRLKLAAELLRSVEESHSPNEILHEAATRNEELESGRVQALEEGEFMIGLKRRSWRP